MTPPDKTPLISVGVSTYNRKDLLRESLNSLLDQTFDDYEIIVVDDGSSDGTDAMVKSEFPQVRYCFKPNGGDASAKNCAARAARGRYLVFNDSDDRFYPDALERLYEPLRHDPEGCSYGQYRHLDADGRESPAKLKLKTFPSRNILVPLIRHVIVHNTACLQPRETFLACGGYDETLRNCYDYKLALEMSLHCNYYALQEPVFQRRRHSGNLSAGSHATISRMFQVVSEFAAAHPELPPEIRRELDARMSGLQLKLAREAGKEGMPGTEIRKHLAAALGLNRSPGTLIRAFFMFLATLK